VKYVSEAGVTPVCHHVCHSLISGIERLKLGGPMGNTDVNI